jgi:hypothetical protein
MSTKQELQELNKKFDVLISLMTQQQQQKTSIEVKESAPVVPVKKKRGRPKKIVVPSEPRPRVEKKVRLFVTPCIRIAGVEYGGNVEVPEGIATQIRYMMQKCEAYERRVPQFIDHGTKDHGVM